MSHDGDHYLVAKTNTRFCDCWFLPSRAHRRIPIVFAYPSQKTFLQATVVFAPEVEDTIGVDDDFSFGFSYSYDIDDTGFSNDWETSSELYFPWEDVMTETDLVALAESLTMALDDGSTTGDIIVAVTLDGASVLPAASGPTEHTAAMVVGYAGAPEVSFCFRVFHTTITVCVGWLRSFSDGIY